MQADKIVKYYTLFYIVHVVLSSKKQTLASEKLKNHIYMFLVRAKTTLLELCSIQKRGTTFFWLGI